MRSASSSRYSSSLLAALVAGVLLAACSSHPPAPEQKAAGVEDGKRNAADAGQVGSGEASVDENWDDWNAARDSLWSKRVSVRGDSVKYLPAELDDEAYELEENGAWETVSYEGKERHFWRPTRVGPDWAPFTAGRWTEYYGDNTWIPDEPFGYATHHYGNWVYVNNAWYWGPPRG